MLLGVVTDWVHEFRMHLLGSADYLMRLVLQETQTPDERLQVSRNVCTTITA